MVKKKSNVPSTEWYLIPFGDCLSTLGNNTLPRAALNYDEGKIRNIHYGDVLIKFPSVLDVQREKLPYINSDVAYSIRSSFLQEGDVVIADTAEDETVGKATEISNLQDEVVVAGLHTIPCRPKNSKMFASKYLGYYINHSSFHDQIVPYITGIKVSSISKSSLEYAYISVPPIDEQERIVEILSDIDELILNLEKLIAKKTTIKQGMMQELITGSRRLEGFRGDWKEDTWENVLNGFISGSTPSRRRPENFQGNIKWVSSGELNYNVIEDTDEHISEAAFYTSNLTLHPANTFLMAVTGMEAAGTRGRCAILGSAAATNQSCMAIYGSSKLEIEFLFYYYMLKGSDLANAYCQGTKQQSYTAKIVKGLPIFYPVDVEEQREIIRVISDSDAEIKNLRKRHSKYIQMKQGLMSELLTGRTRLI